MAVDRIGDGLALRSKGDIISHDGTNPYVLTAGTDGQILTAQSSATGGIQWSDAPTAETQYMEVISSTYITTAATTVSFTNIPATYKDLYVRWAVKTATNDELQVSFNNTTTGTDHQWVFLYTTSTINSSASSTYYVTIQNTYLTTANSGQSYAPGHMTIYQYANTSYHKNGESSGGYRQTSYAYFRTINFTYANTSAINRLDFTWPTGEVSIGSHFTLYGIKE